MGLLGRVKRWLRSAEGSDNREGELSFEAYLESAGEKLRDYAVVISKLESGLLGAKERMRGVERQAAAFRAAAEEAAARQDAEGARAGLEREHECKRRIDALRDAAHGMESGVAQAQRRYASFKQAVDEATAKRDRLMIRTLAASAELEAGKAAGGAGDTELSALELASLAAEARHELTDAGRGEALDAGIAKLLQEQKKD